MRVLAVVLLLAFTACGSVSGPGEDAWDYTRLSDDGAVLAEGTLYFSVPDVGSNFVGEWEAGGQSGKITGAYVGREVQFVIMGGPDTLRHVAPTGDTLEGYWTRGSIVGGSWVDGEGVGVFRAIKH